LLIPQNGIAQKLENTVAWMQGFPPKDQGLSILTEQLISQCADPFFLRHLLQACVCARAKYASSAQKIGQAGADIWLFS
jgi:hypothetical protein